MRPEIRALKEAMGRDGYIADDAIATAVFLAEDLGKPLLVEGDAGVGKTEIAKVIARVRGWELIRLQCNEGRTAEEMEESVFSRNYLLERPLLRALTQKEAPAVLLIDEIDRADEAFEAFLLEVLSDFQVTIPELGTIRAEHIPRVVLTSNCTREIGDALRRRCLYLYIEHPSLEKEVRILQTRVPGASEGLAREIARFVQGLRGQKLLRSPGVAESIDWAQALTRLHRDHLDLETVEATLGCVIKDRRDLRALDRAELGQMIEDAKAS